MRILVTRFSAMGDVALTLPVLAEFSEQYPEHEIILLTKKPFDFFFKGYPRIKVITLDLINYKGLSGIIKLIKLINGLGDIDKYIDLHNNLRTFFIRHYLRIFRRIPVFFLSKRRAEKKAILKGNTIISLPHITAQYSKVFEDAGFKNLISGKISFFQKKTVDCSAQKKIIGIAPFALHKTKVWPIQKMEFVIAHFLKNNYEIYLFGGKEDLPEMNQIKKNFPEMLISRDKYSLEDELKLLPHLSLMITMDSSNMHLASLSGIKVLSVWGPTDPVTGFGPMSEDTSEIISIPREKLDCRPCSVYGKIPCRRGDHACMEWITPGQVIERAEILLHK